jgi:hypothetical protein
LVQKVGDSTKQKSCDVGTASSFSTTASGQDTARLTFIQTKNILQTQLVDVEQGKRIINETILLKMLEIKEIIRNRSENWFSSRMTSDL